MEIGALMFSMEFHGKCPNPPCKYFPWKSMEKFPCGIPWRFFTRVHYSFKLQVFPATIGFQTKDLLTAFIDICFSLVRILLKLSDFLVNKFFVFFHMETIYF